jgi:hypothetical protein
MADIELVIKIPEEEYDLIVNDEACGLNVLTRAIAKGMLLPKGHGRLIDAEVFAHNVVKYSHQSTKTIGQSLSDTPTIIEADKGESEVSDADSD